MAVKPKAFDFRHIQAPVDFHNINEIGDLSEENWLHPVQSLFGNWDARYLILGQDYNSWENIKTKSPHELRHDPNFTTNRNLDEIFSEKRHDLFYANLFWFIKDGKNASSKLSINDEMMKKNHFMFQVLVENLENLEIIFSLGALTSKSLLGWNPVFLSLNDYKFQGRRFCVMPLPHPGNLGLANFCNKRGIDRMSALRLIKDKVQSV